MQGHAGVPSFRPSAWRPGTGEADPSLALRMTGEMESWGATTRRAKPRLKRTLIRPFGPPSPWKGEGPERKENRKTFPPEGGRWRRSRRMRGRLETGKRSKPISLPCRKKKRFLESKEKGAPVGVKWLQIGIRRPGFTPPPRTSTVHRRLRRWNRERLWFYPQFFRRLRGRGLPRGLAGGRRPPLQRRHMCGWGRGDLWSPAARQRTVLFVGRDDSARPRYHRSSPSF